MKVAIVGCGMMGHTHASNLNKMPNVDFVAAFDASPEAAERVALAYNTKGYSSFDKMMKETDPDVVCVLLPTSLHKEYVFKAADYGKHVFCEKPISFTLTEAQDMIDHCESKGVKLFIGHVVRFFPHYAETKRRVNAGEIGQVGVAHAKRVGPHPGKFSPWYNNFTQSGGVIMDLMIHDIDFLRWIFGEVKTVYTLNYRNHDSMDYALVTLQFHNRSIANLEAYWGYPGQFHYGLEVSGNKGLIQFDSSDTGAYTVNKRDSASDSGATSHSFNPVIKDPYYYEMRHFLDSISESKGLLVTPNDAYRNLEIARAAIESATTGQPINV